LGVALILLQEAQAGESLSKGGGPVGKHKALPKK
jgi:hypothetical protein